MLTAVKCAIGGCAALLLSGCGGGGTSAMQSNPTPPPPPAMTAVTLTVTSTANDELTEFDISIKSLTLTSASGNQVSVPVTVASSEFMHVNGGSEPLATAMVPQDTYTAATATLGEADFTCIIELPTNMVIAEFAYGQTPTANVTVTMPSPIVIGRGAIGLNLDLTVSKSASYNSCAGGSAYAITPTFILTGFEFSSAAAGAGAGPGVVRTLDGEVTALDSDSMGFEMTLPSTEPVHVTVDGVTAWQGLSAVTDLRKGSFVDLDGTLRSDGSIAATRVAVADPDAIDVQRGPLLFVSNAEPVLEVVPRQMQGSDLRADMEVFSFSTSTFAVGGAFTNLGSLPFTPSFTAQTMVAGQTVYVSTPAFQYTGPYQATATTVTLMPQTINGTVTGISTSSGFTVYSVALGSYDMFPNLAQQPGQTALLTNPGTIEVYADTNTTMLTAAAPKPGDTLRFYGLVFNDQGTLRMDCAQLAAGVTALSQTPNPLIS
jgi:hypothetical protein